MEEKKYYTEASAKAAKKYKSKFTEVHIRMTPEKREEVYHHAESMNESMTTFITRAIDEQMQRDNDQK